jgi:hypothetical protein
MKNFTAKDNAMVEILEALLATLPKIITAQPHSEKKIDNHEWSNFSKLIKKLDAALAAYKDSDFSYEFYETASDLITEITNYRLDMAWRAALSSSKGITLINHLVASIDNAVSRHEIFAETIYQDQPVTTSSDPLQVAQARIEATSQKTTAAALAAEHANQRAEAFLQQMQAEQARSRGALDPATFEHSIAITLELSIRNLASVIAADSQAEAISLYEELVAQNSKPTL